MRVPAATIAVILLAGCASSQPRLADSEPCEKVAKLAGNGELKPAVDAMEVLKEKDIVCPESVFLAAEKARVRLADADALVLSARGKRQEGDLRGAESDFKRALEVYPKYFWAEKQLQDVQRELEVGEPEAQLEAKQRFDANLSQSREAEARGDLTEASRLTSEMLDRAPADPDSRKQLIEYSRLLGLKLFSEGELTRARDLWRETLALDPSNRKIRDYLEEVDQRLETLEEIKSKDDG